VAIKVALVRNNIRKDGKLAPRVVQRDKIGFDKLLEYMDMSTGLSASDLRSVFLQFAEALAFFLTVGSEVQTPIGAIKLSVHCPGIEAEGPGPDRGKKVSEDDMRLMIRGSRSFLDRLRHGTSIELVDAPPPLLPVITLVENADVHGSIDSGSAGQILHVTGSRLRFTWKDMEQGVFFIPDSGSAGETRMAVYSHIGSSFVDGKIPDLETGEYRLEVRTRPSGRAIRAGQYGRMIAISRSE
jgi:hypothetical protein